VLLDECPKCGVWVDGDEIERILLSAAAVRSPLPRRSIADRYLKTRSSPIATAIVLGTIAGVIVRGAARGLTRR
jgi:hypothetical protein